MLPETISNSIMAAALYALGVFAIYLGTALLANLILGRALTRLARRHDDPLKAIEIRIIGELRRPFVLIIALFGIRAALVSLSQTDAFSLAFIPNLAQIGNAFWLISIAAVVCYTVSRMLRAVMRWYSARTPMDTRTALNTVIWPILIRITSIVVFTLGALVVLDIMGIPITPLLAGIGIGGLAVALALTPTITSFIAGTYVVAEGHVSEGDYIEIDAERAGFVSSIGWRSTVLRSRFNNIVIVPNNLITESVVTNYATPTPSVTGIVECGVSYDSDLRRVEQVCLEIAGAVAADSDSANKEFAPVVRFYEFGDSNINFRIIFQGIDRVASFAMKHQIIMDIHARFKDEGIEINYPVRLLTSASPPSPIKRNDSPAETDAPAADNTSTTLSAAAAAAVIDAIENADETDPDEDENRHIQDPD